MLQAHNRTHHCEYHVPVPFRPHVLGGVDTLAASRSAASPAYALDTAAETAGATASTAFHVGSERIDILLYDDECKAHVVELKAVGASLSPKRDPVHQTRRCPRRVQLLKCVRLLRQDPRTRDACGRLRGQLSPVHGVWCTGRCPSSLTWRLREQRWAFGREIRATATRRPRRRRRWVAAAARNAVACANGHDLAVGVVGVRSLTCRVIRHIRVNGRAAAAKTRPQCGCVRKIAKIPEVSPIRRLTLSCAHLTRLLWPHDAPRTLDSHQQIQLQAPVMNIVNKEKVACAKVTDAQGSITLHIHTTANEDINADSRAYLDVKSRRRPASTLPSS